MKKIIIYLSLLLAFSMMLCSTSSFAVSDFLLLDDELQPMAANSCPANYSLYYPDGRIYANVHFDHSHGGMQPHVHVYTWHQGPNGQWNSSKECKEYDSTLYPRP